MALINKILSWSTTLPVWQRDAIRRLFQQEDLTQQDYEDLYAMLKAAHGIPDPQNRQPIPLAAKHLPAKITEATVVLKAMRDLQHVNRIASGQTLPFSPTGITVIYGENSSGKSGYSRVLKRACRARDQAENVLTDATNPAEQSSIPEAIFDITIGTEPKPVKWRRGTPSPDELSTIAVFDAHCARSYMKEGEAAYLPYGMDIVVNLADKVIPQLSGKLKQEINGVSVDVTPFNHLLGQTAVGKLIASLSHKTNPTEINTLATLSEAEISRIAELKAVLSEADPKAKAEERKLSAGRIKDVAERVAAAFAWVKDDAVAKLRTICDAALAAEEAEKAPACILRSGESLLPGTGEQVWKSLFEAARKFSTEVAYRDHPFSYTDDGAVCPLCQQPLANAGERLKRFEKYIQDDAAKTANEKRQQLSAAKTKIERGDITIGLNISLKRELTQFDSTLVRTTTAFAASIEAQRSWMLEATNSHCWDNMPQLSKNPTRALRGLAARQLIAARTFKKAADEIKKKAMEGEYGELVARQKLKQSLDPILALLERMKLKENLEKCNNDLKTRPITDMSKDLANKVITPELQKAIDCEFQTLDIGHIKTKLNPRPEKGKIQYSLLLDLPTTAKLEAILSEGEQRAIAIGSFLAELQLADHEGAIVFDDPVSSLDHHRRMRVAKRIVREAAHRQVIVFTHDTAFLGELLDQIESQKVGYLVHHLEWANDIPGYVSDGLPWGHQGYKERLNTLKQNCNKIAENWPVRPNEDDRATICHQYIHASGSATRFDALEPLRQGVRDYFGAFGQDVAQGLSLRHDHGSQYVSDHFQNEIRFLGMTSSPAFVREPEGNGCAERFIRTVKENLLWVRTFQTIEELRQALLEFKERYNYHWIIERLGYRTPAQARKDACITVEIAA